jgi:hypothetical protein
MTHARPPRHRSTERDPGRSIPDVLSHAGLGVTSPEHLMHLQRTAGNAAVARLVRVAPRPPPRRKRVGVQRQAVDEQDLQEVAAADVTQNPAEIEVAEGAEAEIAAPEGAEVTEDGELRIQRCGPVDCDCSDEERSANEGVPVQRGILDSVKKAAANVVPDWVKSRVTAAAAGARAKAAAMRSEAAREAGDATGAARGVGRALQQQTGARIAGVERKTSSDQELGRAQVAGLEAAMRTSATKATGLAVGLAGAGTTVGALLNPAVVAARPDQVTKVAGQIEPLEAAGPPGLQGLGSAVQGTVLGGLSPASTWNCDISEIMARGGGVHRRITDGIAAARKGLPGDDRLNKIVTATGEAVAWLRTTAAGVKSAIGRGLGKLGAWWREPGNRWRKGAEGALQATEQSRQLQMNLLTAPLMAPVDGAVAAWKLYEQVGPAISDQVGEKRRSIEAGIQKIEQAAGPAGSLVRPLLTGILQTVTGPAGAAVALGSKAAGFVRDHKGEILGGIRKAADGATRLVARGYTAVKGWFTGTKTKDEETTRAVDEKLRAAEKSTGDKLDGAAEGTIDWILKSADDVAEKVKGTACAQLGEAAGPCFDQYLPEGVDTEFELKGDLVAPIPGVAVPVKVARGGKMTVKREGQTFEAEVSGEGSAGIAYDLGSGGAAEAPELKIALPFGQQQVFKKLTGQPVTPAGPAQEAIPPPMAAPPTNAPVAPAGQAPSLGGSPAGDTTPAQVTGGPKGTVEAGLKGSLAMTYTFDASADKTSCDGAGGLASLLASQGFGALLPAPFGTIVSAAGRSGWEHRLTACKFGAASFGGAQFELTGGGLEDLKAKVEAEQGATVKRTFALGEQGKRGASQGTEAELYRTLGADLSAKVTSLSGVGGAGAATTGKMFLRLRYDHAADKIDALDAGAQVAMKLGLSESEKLVHILPRAALAVVDARLAPILGGQNEGEIEVEAGQEITQLHDFATALDQVLSKPEDVTLDQVWTVVEQHLKENAKPTLKVTLTLKSALVKAEAKGGVGKGPERVAMSGEGSLIQSRKIVLYEQKKD